MAEVSFALAVKYSYLCNRHRPARRPRASNDRFSGMNACFDETECLIGIADDNSDAFEVLFRHYYPKAVIFLSAITGDESASEDIAQDIFLKIWTSRKALPGIRDFGAWLYVMSRNAALMQLRKKRPSTSIEDLEIVIDGFIEERCELSLDRESIRRVVDKMPSRRKEVYTLSREQGLSNAEIAERLGIEKKTVENHLNLALKEIRDVLMVLFFFI